MTGLTTEPNISDWDFEALVFNWHKLLLDPNTSRSQTMLSIIEEEWQYREVEIDLDADCPWEGLTDNPNQGLLSVLGYHVGITQSQPVTLRHKILQRAVVAQLPIVHSQSYMVGWGKQHSRKRKAKIVGTISRFIEQKGTYAAYGQAVKNWTKDLHMTESLFHSYEATGVH